MAVLRHRAPVQIAPAPTIAPSHLSFLARTARSLTMRIRRPFGTHPSLLGGFLLIISVILFYSRLVTSFPSPWVWGNFTSPLTLHVNLIGLSEIYWNPFQYNGLVSVSPVSSALSFGMSNGAIYILSAGFGYPGGVTAYELGSVMFLGGAFFFLTGQLTMPPDSTRRAVIRTLSTAFVLFNPFMISMLSAGNFAMFVGEGFLFLAIALACLSITTERLRPWTFLLSVALLSFTAAFYQLFLLGSLLYISMLAYRVATIRAGHGLRAGILDLSKILLRFALLFGAFSLPFLLAAYSGSFDLSTQTTQVAPSFANFVAFSDSVPNVLFLHGYFGNLGWQIVLAWGGEAVYALWALLLTSLLVVALIFGFIYRRAGAMLLSCIAVGAALLGAGPQSVIAPLPEFLFVHFPGYASINASYYWEWFLLSPIYSILLIDMLSQTKLPSAFPPRAVRSLRLLQRSRRRLKPWSSRVPVIAAVLLALILALPIASQGYYNHPNGVYNALDGLPSSYSGLPALLESLTQKSGTGAAYFPLDEQLSRTNGTTGIVNPLTYYPTVRSAYLPFYGSPETSYSSFFWWLYNLFYQNQTSNLPQLMSLADIKYFVSLYDMNSGSWPGWAYGVNASSLLGQQQQLVPAVSAKDYEIFSSTLNVAPAYGVSNLTLVDGNYNTLDQMAAIGLNLSQMAVTFQSDLPALNLSWALNRTAEVILSSPQSWLDIALSTLSSDCVNPASFTGAADQQAGWTSSTVSPYDFPYYYETMEPFAFTSSSTTLNISLPGGRTPGVANTFVLVHYSGSTGGSLRISGGRGGPSQVLNTRGGYDGITNSFLWVELPGNFSATKYFSLSSLAGFNAVGPVCQVTPQVLQGRIKLIQDSLVSRGIPIIFLMNAHQLALSPDALRTGSWAPNLNNYATPEGESLVLDASLGFEPSVNFTLPFSNGTLEAQAMASNGGDIRVTEGNASTTFGWGNGNFNPAAYSWLQVPLPNGGGSQVQLQTTLGTTQLGELVYSNAAARRVVKSEPAAPGVISTVYVSGGLQVNDLNVSVANTSNSTRISGQFYYSNATKNHGQIVSIYFSNAFPYSSTLQLVYDMSSAATGFMNGIVFAGDSNGSTFATSPAFYLSYTRPFPDQYYLRIYPTVFANVTSLVTFSILARVSPESALPGTVLAPQTTPLFAAISSSFLGYSIQSRGQTLILSTYSYFPSLVPTAGDWFPAAGGINTLWLAKGTVPSQVTFVSKQFVPTLIGLSVSGLTILGYATYEIAIRRKHTYRGRPPSVTCGSGVRFGSGEKADTRSCPPPAESAADSTRSIMQS